MLIKFDEWKIGDFAQQGKVTIIFIYLFFRGASVQIFPSTWRKTGIKKFKEIQSSPE